MENTEEKHNEEEIHILEELVQSIGELGKLCSQQEDSAAAELYRLMFKHERNINILDQYADIILDYVTGFGGEHAEEDYRNFLQYLGTVLPSEYKEHKEFFEDMIKEE